MPVASKKLRMRRFRPSSNLSFRTIDKTDRPTTPETDDSSSPSLTPIVEELHGRSSKILLKVAVESDTQTVHHRIRSVPTLKHVRRAISSKLRLYASTFELSYEDDEGDDIIIKTNEDLLAALHACASGIPKLRLRRTASDVSGLVKELKGWPSQSLKRLCWTIGAELIKARRLLRMRELEAEKTTTERRRSSSLKEWGLQKLTDLQQAASPNRKQLTCEEVTERVEEEDVSDLENDEV